MAAKKAIDDAAIAKKLVEDEAEKKKRSVVGAAAEEVEKKQQAKDDVALIAAVNNKGTTKWCHSKMLLVGEGRAGKSALANSIIGKPFCDTPSTVGINELTCDIKYAASSGDSGNWGEVTKPSKELESVQQKQNQRQHRFQWTIPLHGSYCTTRPNL